MSGSSKLNKQFLIIVISTSLFLSACGGSGSSDPDGLGSPENNQTISCETTICKPLPVGVYESAGFTDPVGNAVNSNALSGILVRISWNACGDDQECLLDMVEEQLDKALSANLKVSLMIMDGDEAPDGVKSRCQTFAFEKRGVPASMCLAWDNNYLQDKMNMVTELGQRFDDHPALAYIYFTGACATNGAEGHCRIDEAAYSAAGYTPDKLKDAYITIMDAYRSAFPITPIVFEVHAIFDTAEPWQSLWNHVADTGRVGVAAWWCSERLTLNGNDTVPVWPIIQAAAQNSFSVCQTVGNFSNQPYRFTDQTLGLDYGAEDDWNQDDVNQAFNQSIDWIQGLRVHSGQASLIKRFSVIESWSVDLKNQDFQDRLLSF